MWRAVLVLMAIVVLSSCAPGEEAPRSGSMQSPSTGPAQRQDEAWGPLAVADYEHGMEALIEGVTMRITDECVFMTSELLEQPRLLVWPASRTTWNEDTRSISLQNDDEETITVADGARVNMGGGASKIDNFDKAEQYLDWVSKPSPTCRSDVVWVVGSLYKAPTS